MNKLTEKLVLLFLLLCIGLSITAALDCEDQGALHALQVKCFKDQGIQIADPPTSSDHTYYEKRRLWLEALVAQMANSVCLRQHQFQTAMECDHSIISQCIHPDYIDKLPVKDKIRMIVPVLCDTQHHVNFDCAKNKTSALLDCDIPNKSASSSEDDSKDALCNSHESPGFPV